MSVDHGIYNQQDPSERPIFLDVAPGMTVIVRHDFLTGEKRDKDWWMGQVSDGRISGENPWYLQYDPPGTVDGAMYHSDNERRLKYFGSIFGDCEASDASAYETSK